MPLPAESRQRVRFGQFELDLQTRELRKNGRIFSLQDQPFQVLALLLARPGELVTREELKERLWSSDTFVDFDQGLNKAVNRLREALQDSAADPRWIETLAGRGYRFTASVTVEAAGQPAASSAESTAAPIQEPSASSGSSVPESSSPSPAIVANAVNGDEQRDRSEKIDGKTEQQLKPALTGGNANVAGTMKTFNRNILRGMPWLAAAGFIVAVGLIYFLQLPRPMRVIHSQIAPPEGTGFSSTLGYNTSVPVVSPDGKNLAFAATGQDNKRMIWVRSLDTAQHHPLPGTEDGIGPFWSPDSKSIAFFAASKLKTVGLNNDNPIVVCDAANGARGGSWGIDGTILFAPGPRTPIFRVSAQGGLPSTVTKIDDSKHTSHRWPFMLPDGRHFLYLAVNFFVPEHDDDGVYYASLDGSDNHLVLKTHRNAEYASGYLLFVRDGVLLAQHFDPVGGKLDGEFHPIAEKVAEDPAVWKSVISVSPAGLLAYAPAKSVHNAQLMWFDRTGRQLGNGGDELKGQIYRGFRLSPQGDRIAIGIDAGVTDVWVLNLGQPGLVRLTFQENSIMPVWSPDGKWIAFLSYTGHWKIARKASDGTGKEEILLENTEATWPLAWSPDSTCFLYARREKGKYELWTLPLAGDREPAHIATAGERVSATFSPDGRWIAYASSETGKAEIYLTGFDRDRGKWQVSRDGGTSPVWAATNEIFYIAPDNTLTVTPVKENTGKMQIGLPYSLFRIRGSGYFDVSADGRRILVGIAGVASANPVDLVLNWTADLEK